MPRYAARVDANQARIVKALRKIGVAVTPLHTVGNGCGDLLASFRGIWAVLEIKDGSKPPSARKLTPAERLWISLQHAPVHVVTTEAEAIAVFAQRSRKVSST
jgi:hypothetical protein